MSASPVSFGYVILTVRDVPATLAFYEAAFGLTRRFLHDADGMAYGELETGATRLAFNNPALAELALGCKPLTNSLQSTPQAVEIALVTPDVPALYAKALRAGATPFREPAAKPWGQIVGYVRDPDGHLVELCSPLG